MAVGEPYGLEVLVTAAQRIGVGHPDVGLDHRERRIVQRPDRAIEDRHGVVRGARVPADVVEGGHGAEDRRTPGTADPDGAAQGDQPPRRQPQAVTLFAVLENGEGRLEPTGAVGDGDPEPVPPAAFAPGAHLETARCRLVPVRAQQEPRAPLGHVARVRPCVLARDDADHVGPAAALREEGRDGVRQQPRALEPPEELQVVVPAVHRRRHRARPERSALVHVRVRRRLEGRAARGATPTNPATSIASTDSVVRGHGRDEVHPGRPDGRRRRGRRRPPAGRPRPGRSPRRRYL